VDQRRMRRLLVATSDLSNEIKRKRSERTGNSQIRLLIFDVVFGQNLREIRSKIPIHFDAMGPGVNQGKDGSSHVVGGTTEYLSTMRRF
jgi:hypothetical protein